MHPDWNSYFNDTEPLYALRTQKPASTHVNSLGLRHSEILEKSETLGLALAHVLVAAVHVYRTLVSKSRNLTQQIGPHAVDSNALNHMVPPLL